MRRRWDGRDGDGERLGRLQFAFGRDVEREVARLEAQGERREVGGVVRERPCQRAASSAAAVVAVTSHLICLPFIARCPRNQLKRGIAHCPLPTAHYSAEEPILPLRGNGQRVMGNVLASSY
jgi:hypothetical protein